MCNFCGCDCETCFQLSLTVTDEEPTLFSIAKAVTETRDMLKEIKEFLDPLKALAAGLGPMQKMGMSPAAKAAAARLRELS